ncbi:MAG: hypothetical protein AB8G05_10630 [Oligoflexales bacterium]
MSTKLNRMQTEEKYGPEEQSVFNEYRNTFQTPECSSLFLAPGVKNNEIIQSAWLMTKSVTKEGSFTPTLIQMILFATSVFGGNSYCTNLHANAAIATGSNIEPKTLIDLIHDIAVSRKSNLPKKTLETIHIAIKVLFQDEQIDLKEDLTRIGYNENDIDLFTSIITAGVFFNTIFKVFEVPEDSLSSTPFSKDDLDQINFAIQNYQDLRNNSKLRGVA